MKAVLRWASQLGSAAVLTWLFLRQDYATAVRPVFTWLGWLDPLLGLAGVVHGRWPVWLLLSLGALALAAWRGRVFCGWVCPVGAVLDTEAACLRLVHWRDRWPDRRARRLWDRLRWVVFGGVVALAALGRFEALALDPLVLWPREVSRITLSLVPWSLAAILLAGLVAFPRFWCRFLCPTGSLLHLASRLSKARTAGQGCRRCGWCVRRCPLRNIGEDLRFGSDCLDCGCCVRACPARCLSRKERRPGRTDEGRRDLLYAAGAGLGLLMVGAAGRIVARPANAPTRWPRLLRPPGALTEEALADACTRCEQCLQVCPSQCLVPTGVEAGLGGLWTPRFVPRRGRCMFCMACGQVCPTGALAVIPMQAARLGTARIDPHQCLAWGTGTRCLLCVETCPAFAISIDLRERPVIDAAKCIGCGACEAGCPVEGSAVLLTCAGETRR